MSPDDLRKLALSFAGAAEKSHMTHPDFRVDGRIFATLGYPDETWGMIKLPPDEQARLVRAKPDTFMPAKGAWGASGSTLVKLASVNERTLRMAMAAAWKNAASKQA